MLYYISLSFILFVHFYLSYVELSMRPFICVEFKRPKGQIFIFMHAFIMNNKGLHAKRQFTHFKDPVLRASVPWIIETPK